ncbi:MAG TPA: nitroreductase family deazaflavin-dependent oxidoreductase [Ktedonobacteraceae bacterium]
MSVENQTVDTNSPAKKPNTGAERFFTGMHVFFYRLSGGKLGGTFGNSPVLLLNTVGRKTGQPRTSPLLYLQDGNDLILVASHGGAPKHPAWWLNLQAKPETEVEVGRKKLKVTARQADAEERARLWPLLVDMYGSYADYQKKTMREIPVVILHPQD